MDKLFGEWLQNELVSRNWSQSDLARNAAISRQVVSDYINAKKLNPDEKILVAIARAFRIPPEEAFRAAGILPNTDPATTGINRIMHRVANLPPEDQELVDLYIDTLITRRENRARKQPSQPAPAPDTP